MNTATWWIAIPSPDLTAEPAITQLQAWLLPVTAAVAAGSVIAAGARMAITRRASPAAGRDRRPAHPRRGSHPRRRDPRAAAEGR